MEIQTQLQLYLDGAYVTKNHNDKENNTKGRFVCHVQTWAMLAWEAKRIMMSSFSSFT